MTTASPDDSTIRYTDAIKTRYISPTETSQATDWSAWEAWLAARLDQRCETFGEEVVEAIGQQMTDPLEKRIRLLEQQLAETRGAVDVLRGRGAPGAFRARGTYDTKAAYVYLDVVTKDSSSFVALRDSPGSCPGDGWQMIACGGKRGPAGERGPAGPAGTAPRMIGTRITHRGLEIETNMGPIPLFKSVAVNAQDFTIKFIANDDSTLSISLLPLFEAYHRQATSP
jgi:hypothetical protein